MKRETGQYRAPQRPPPPHLLGCRPACGFAPAGSSAAPAKPEARARTPPENTACPQTVPARPPLPGPLAHPAALALDCHAADRRDAQLPPVKHHQRTLGPAPATRDLKRAAASAQHSVLTWPEELSCRQPAFLFASHLGNRETTELS